MKFLAVAQGMVNCRFRGAPLYSKIYVTRNCNYRCIMCNVWTHTNRVSELGVDSYRKIARILWSLGVRIAVITGGEPTLREDLAEIISIFSKEGFSVRLQTNGGPQLTENKLKSYVAAGLDDINISLDTLDSETFDNICGFSGAWEYAVTNLKRASKYLNKGIRAISITISSLNVYEVLDIVSFANKLGAYVILMPVMLSTSAESTRLFEGYTDNMKDLHGIPDVDRVFKELLEAKKRGSKLLISAKYLNDMLHSFKSRDIRWNCDAGRLYFVVREDGSVSPCDDLPAIANILEDNFIDVFRSKLYRKKTETMRKACNGCTHPCWHELSNLVHSNQVLIERIKDYIVTKFFPIRMKDGG